MSKLTGLLTGLGVTALGVLWFYGVMYSWLWMGLTHSTTNGWIVGYAILFIIFLILSIIIIVFLGLGYALAIAIAE